MNEAVSNLEKAISVDPTFVHSYLLLARIYWFAFNDTKRAERLLRIAYVLNPESSSVVNGLLGLLARTRKHHLIPFLLNKLPLPPFEE